MSTTTQSASTRLPRRRLGGSDLQVSCIGLGCMGMSYAYGAADEQESLRVLRRYLERGGNFLDTAEIYGPFDNETLLGRFLKDVPRESVVVATKFGFRIDRATRKIEGADSSPANIRKVCDESLRPARHRADRSPVSASRRSERADRGRRGHASRDLITRRQGPRDRPVRSRPGDAAHGARRAPDRGAAERVLALVARPGDERRAGDLPRARDRVRRRTARSAAGS